VLTIAEENQKHNENHFRDLIFGLLDVCMLLLLFLPIFASNSDGTVRESSLLFLDISSVYVKMIYLTLVGLMSISGTLMLALQNCSSLVWLKIKSKLSLVLGIFAVLVFIIGRQPYAAVFSFSMLVVKASLLLKRL
jgi:hypothetical protein